MPLKWTWHAAELCQRGKYPHHTSLVQFSGMSGPLSLALGIMQPNSPDMTLRHTKKVQLGKIISLMAGSEVQLSCFIYPTGVSQFRGLCSIRLNCTVEIQFWRIDCSSLRLLFLWLDFSLDIIASILKSLVVNYLIIKYCKITLKQLYS